MKNEDEASHNSSVQRRNDVYMAIFNQLLQAASTMRHIDELLLWLANLMVYRLGVQAAQIWAGQRTQYGQASLELRSIAFQDTAFPQNLLVNAQSASVVERLMAERRSASPQPIDVIFPQHLSMLLKRHGLSYCSSLFFSSPLLLPPPRAENGRGKIPTPLIITSLLFFRQLPSQDVQPLIGSIFHQAIQVAGSRELLLPVSELAPQQQATPALHPQRPAFVLSEIIPRRNQDTASNPLGGVILPEKQARRLYAAIDGRKNIGALAEFTQMDVKTVLGLLQMLLAQRYIRLYEPGGQPVDDSVILDNR